MIRRAPRSAVTDRFHKGATGLHAHGCALPGVDEVQACEGFSKIERAGTVAEIDRLRPIRVQHAPLALLALQADQHAAHSLRQRIDGGGTGMPIAARIVSTNQEHAEVPLIADDTTFKM
ncbi:hypothetical protein G6F57_016772 [Rhizopus arrhizus]|nr:hypothetical protein G6F57_016772 [Rhizopus arrhizus]